MSDADAGIGDGDDDACGSEVFRGVVLMPYWVLVLCACVTFPFAASLWKCVRRRRCLCRPCDAAACACPMPNSAPPSAPPSAVASPQRPAPLSVRVEAGADALVPSAAAGVVAGDAPAAAESRPATSAVEAADLRAESCGEFLLHSDAEFLLCQALLHAVHFVYCAATARDGLSAAAPAWHAYGALYVRWLNSGAPVALANAVFAVNAAGAEAARARSVNAQLSAALQRQHTLTRWAALLLLALSAPVVVTHTLPMAFGPYIWLIPVFFALMLVGSRLTLAYLHVNWYGQAPAPGAPRTTLDRWLWPYVPVALFLMRLFGVLSLCACLLTATNYAVLWYSGGSACSYDRIIVAEWGLRRSLSAAGAREYFTCVADSGPQLFAFLTLIL